MAARGATRSPCIRRWSRSHWWPDRPRRPRRFSPSSGISRSTTRSTSSWPASNSTRRSSRSRTRKRPVSAYHSRTQASTFWRRRRRPATAMSSRPWPTRWKPMACSSRPGTLGASARPPRTCVAWSRKASSARCGPSAVGCSLAPSDRAIRSTSSSAVR